MGDFPRAFDPDFEGQKPPAKVRTRHEKRMLRQAAAEGELAEARPFEHVPLSADVRLRAPVFDTEARAKVESAVRALFPDARFSAAAPAGWVEATARDLRPLAETLRHTRIRDTAREVLRHAVGADGVLRLRLNKQAAFAARVNFVEAGELLGSLEVELRAPEPAFLAEELTWIEGESDERLFGTKLHTLPPRRSR